MLDWWNDRRLRNTSQIIQTSIGGGNSRVSALGIASTIANLSQIKIICTLNYRFY